MKQQVNTLLSIVLVIHDVIFAMLVRIKNNMFIQNYNYT